MFYVYLLKSENQRYIGSTSNLRRRIQEHNSGKNRSTKPYKNWVIIYYEAYTNEDDAKRGEEYFKTSQGRQALSRMLRSYYQAK